MLIALDAAGSVCLQLLIPQLDRQIADTSMRLNGTHSISISRASKSSQQGVGLFS